MRIRLAALKILAQAAPKEAKPLVGAMIELLEAMAEEVETLKKEIHRGE